MIDWDDPEDSLAAARGCLAGLVVGFILWLPWIIRWIWG